jgi:signal transduction histidine kinase
MKDADKTKSQLIDELQQLRIEYSQYKENNPDAAMWQQVIDRSPFSIQVVDKEGFSLSVNQAHTDFFRAVPEPTYNLFTDPQLLAQGLDEWFERLKQGEAVFFPDTSYNPSMNNPEYPDITVWLKTCSFPMLDADGKPMRYVVIHENISNRIQTEKELNDLTVRLQSMAAHIQYSVEKEKTYIANELHDQVGQYLTGMKFDLDAVIINMQESEKVKQIRNTVVRINELIGIVQNLTATIKPVVLSGMGLKADVDWFVREFEQRTQMDVFMDIDYTLDISEEAALSIFRILQESLTNIGRHSKASRVEIIVKKVNESFHFVISDNGIGITEEQINSQKSFGIIIMKERVNAMGGTFIISSKNKTGTRIDISIPLKQQKS